MPKLSKEARARISRKIAILINEGMDKKRAAATAYSMEKEGRLGEHGEYERVKEKK
jgi:hypothetical protein